MSDSKNKSAYGVAASDTDFRKNWDLDEYAAKAKEREAKEKEEAKARYEAKLAGKKYHKPMTGNETYTSARRNIIDVSAQVGKTQIVPAGSGVGKRGRGAGFYCEACDLTFKDNLQWVEVCTHTCLLREVRRNINTGANWAFIAFKYDSASAQHRADHRSQAGNRRGSARANRILHSPRRRSREREGYEFTRQAADPRRGNEEGGGREAGEAEGRGREEAARQGTGRQSEDRVRRRCAS